MTVIKETPTAALRLVNGVLQQQWMLYVRRHKNDKQYKAGGTHYWQLVWRTVPDMGNNPRYGDEK